MRRWLALLLEKPYVAPMLSQHLLSYQFAARSRFHNTFTSFLNAKFKI